VKQRATVQFPLWLREPGCGDADRKGQLHHHVRIREQRQPPAEEHWRLTITYVYDYGNRLIALGSQGATTTSRL